MLFFGFDNLDFAALKLYTELTITFFCSNFDFVNWLEGNTETQEKCVG